jgi:hypothetical protein
MRDFFGRSAYSAVAQLKLIDPYFSKLFFEHKSIKVELSQVPMLLQCGFLLLKAVCGLIIDRHTWSCINSVKSVSPDAFICPIFYFNHVCEKSAHNSLYLSMMCNIHGRQIFFRGGELILMVDHKKNISCCS